MHDLKPLWGTWSPSPAHPHLLQSPELAPGSLAWLRGVPMCLSRHLSLELRPGNTCTLVASWTSCSLIPQYFVSLRYEPSAQVGHLPKGRQSPRGQGKHQDAEGQSHGGSRQRKPLKAGGL